MCNRAQVSMVVRADCVPERWPAILGRWRFWAQRPFPSMMTATCLGRRVKSSFSSSSASSEVTGPSDSRAGTWGVLWSLVCDTTVFADRFPRNPLYAAKLTYAAKAMQRNIRAMLQKGTLFCPVPLMHFTQRGINHHGRKNDHRHRGNPGHPVEPSRVNLIPHQVLPVHQDEKENQHDRKQKPVQHLGPQQNGFCVLAEEQDQPRAKDNQRRVQAVEDLGIFEFMVDSGFET